MQLLGVQRRNREEDSVLAVAINHGEQTRELSFETEYPTGEVLYGDPGRCMPMDGVIVRFSKNNHIL